MYNSFKLKKIVLDNFKIFKGIQKIEFVNVDDKKVILIMGNNGSGKTILFNAIKEGLSSTNEKKSNCFLDTSFDKSLITENNKWMFCLDGELITGLYEEHKEFLTSEVVEKMNEFRLTYLRKDILNFTLGDDGKLDVKRSYGRSVNMLINLFFLLAVKHFLFKNSFLVFDMLFHNVQADMRIDILTLIMNNCDQLILISSPLEIENYIHDETQSVEKIIKNRTSYLKFALTYIPEKEGTEIKQYD